MSAQEPEVGQAIRDEGVISEKTEGALHKAIEFYGNILAVAKESQKLPKPSLLRSLMPSSEAS